MRILIINSLSICEALGGAERSTHMVASQLAENGHDVRLIAFSQGKRRDLDLDGISVGLFSLPNIYWPFSTRVHSTFHKLTFHALDLLNPIAAWFVLTEISRFKPDIIWTNMLKGWSCAPWMIGRILSIPVVSTMREFDMLYKGSELMTNPSTPQKIPVIWRLRRFLSRLPDAFVGISEDIRNRYLSEGYYPKSSTHVIHNPVKSGKNNWLSRSQFRRNRALRIGWLGRFAGEKGLQIYLDCVEYFNERLDLEFHVAGDGDPNLRAKVESLHSRNYLKYWGYCESAEFYGSMDIAIVSSLAPEPFGRVVIEAFQQRCYVISSDRGGLPEVNCNSQCGKIYDGTLAALITAIEDISKQEVIGDLQSFEEETEKYDSALIARNYERIFKGL